MELTHGESSGEGSSGTLWQTSLPPFHHHTELADGCTWYRGILPLSGEVSQTKPETPPTPHLYIPRCKQSLVLHLLSGQFLPSLQPKIVPRLPAVAFFSPAPGSHSLLYACLHSFFFPPALNKQPHEPYLQATSSLVFFLSLVWAMTDLCPFSP